MQREDARLLQLAPKILPDLHAQIGITGIRIGERCCSWIVGRYAGATREQAQGERHGYGNLYREAIPKTYGHAVHPISRASWVRKIPYPGLSQ